MIKIVPKSMECFDMFGLCVLFLSLITLSSTLEMITPTQPVRDPVNENVTLVSTNGTFEAGFFSLENSGSRYLGIWYKNISPRTVVWVANKETPLQDHSGVLEVDGDEGFLSIKDGTGAKIWFSNASSHTPSKPVAVELLESGNMVVKDGMKLGTNFKTGHHRALRSWKSFKDPTPGEFVFGVDTRGLPQLVITKEPSDYLRSRLIPEGYQVRLIWSDETKRWDTQYPGSFDECERYGIYAIGFQSNFADSTCDRTTPLDCNKGDKFQRYEGMKLPDTSSSWYDKSISLGECEKLCLSNCSCTAYAQLNISVQGSGCLHWFHDIVDIGVLAQGGQDFYLRITTSKFQVTFNFTIHS
ncbi:hypothetical protein PHAVU_003G099300 [Phaseolus vulgaris]|uniref:Bulb-type lectin domain-containing protein n=1 Tax=Phaseolus vulgaris TaxID=3885 RepID=V7CA41_PHAVU|nr:hypothetical protein PHAVU_003G099300g [Phaseolus vulgaris]ESW26203.1 hypothetical protein PHAVU_003G099300g [Phaseolus vulgaris]